MKTRYDEARSVSRQLGERGDCAVIAVSVAGRMNYVQAHELLRDFGRRSGKGTGFHQTTKPALEAAGFVLTREKKERQKNGSRYTPKTIGEKCKNGYYLCRSKKHIFAVVNGVVQDWTDGRKHPINEIWKVTKPHSKKG